MSPYVPVANFDQFPFNINFRHIISRNVNQNQWRRHGEKTGGETKRGTKARKTSRRVRGMPPGTILSSRVSEMPFPAFWGVMLQTSEDYKTSHKIPKRQHISGL